MAKTVPLGIPYSVQGELERFLRRGRLESFTIAEGVLPPPPLGFMVSFPRLSLTLRGTDEMEIERHRQRVTIRPRRGEAVFVPANAWNRPTWSRPVKVLHFLFGPRHTGISLVEHGGRSGEPDRVLKTSLPPIEGALHEVLNALTLLPGEGPAGELGPLLVQALLTGVAHLLQKPPAAGVRKGRHSYDKVCLYLQENFHRPVTRDSVAAQFQFNPNHLSRLFMREGLMRFTDYLAWVRVDRAKYLLKHHGLKLDELARACGFQDTAYFCRVFKQRTNQTPTQYRITARGQ